MINDKMCFDIHFDKKWEIDLLIARIGKNTFSEALKRAGCLPMDFTGRSMKDYVIVTAKGIDRDEDLQYWIQLCLDYNPLSKASKKK